MNCLLMLRDHLRTEIEEVEQEIGALEVKLDERRQHHATLERVRRAANITHEPAVVLTLEKGA